MAQCEKVDDRYVLTLTEAEAQAVLAAVGCLGADFPDTVLEVLDDALPLAGRLLVKTNGFGVIVPA
ncbi:MAG: hypothetical protein R2708_27250 [Vicinamibacterales bacterium]